LIRKDSLDFGFCVYPDAGFNTEYIGGNLYVVGCQCIVFYFLLLPRLAVCLFAFLSEYGCFRLFEEADL